MKREGHDTNDRRREEGAHYIHNRCQLNVNVTEIKYIRDTASRWEDNLQQPRHTVRRPSQVLF